MNEEERDLHLPISPSIWVKLVLMLGFFLQLVLAFILFIVLHVLSLFDVWGENIALMFELLFSLLPATSLGFLLSNFIFHSIPPIREKLDEVNDYAATQKLLFKLFLVTLLFIVVAGSFVLLLMQIL